MKPLHELTPEQKTRLLAELDGKECCCKDGLCDDTHGDYCCELHYPTAFYLTSYDAIVPLVQKLIFSKRQAFYRAIVKIRSAVLSTGEKMCIEDALLFATPSQLRDAVLVATGKAEV